MPAEIGKHYKGESFCIPFQEHTNLRVWRNNHLITKCSVYQSISKLWSALKQTLKPLVKDKTVQDFFGFKLLNF